MWVVHTSGSRRGRVPLELEEVVWVLIWVLETKVGSSGRTMGALELDLTHYSIQSFPLASKA